MQSFKVHSLSLMMIVCMDLTIGKSHFVLKILLLLCVAYQDRLGPLRGALAGSHDYWSFTDLKNDMDDHGNAGHTQSPVGRGLYLDGSDDTYVKLKGHDENCMEDPSRCNITIGFFFKFKLKPGTQTVFGNKDDNDALYKGVNIFYKADRIYVLVYGTDNFCKLSFHPPLGVWFYLGLVWEKIGKLAVFIDGNFRNPHPNNCDFSPGGLKTRRDYYLGRHTFPIAYYKDLNIWYSKQAESVLDAKWEAAFNNHGSTEIRLKIIFSDLAYNSGNAGQWKTDFEAKVRELYNGDAAFQKISNVQFSNSDGNASVSFKVKFTRISWTSILTLQLALEQRTFLGSRGVFDEAGCSNIDYDHFICQVPKNYSVHLIKRNQVFIRMGQVLDEEHEKYFYGYRVLHKNLDDPNSTWVHNTLRRNEPPIIAVATPLIPHRNYSFRVMATSFESEGLISEAIQATTYESVPSVGPALVAYYNTSSTTIYVQWDHTIPENKVNGILIGYRVWWNDPHFPNNHIHDSKGSKDLGLDAKYYTITSLHENWVYNIGVAGRTSAGAGKYSRATVTTPDDVPSAPPDNIQLVMHNSTSLQASWGSVSFIHQNGVMRGYRIVLQQEDAGPVLWNTTLSQDVHLFSFTGLLIFQSYSLQIMAFNVKGTGPYSKKIYQMTDGSVPINSPVSLTAHNISSGAIQVQWDYNDDPRLVQGHLQGFTLYFLEANASDVFTDQGRVLTFVRNQNRSTVIEGLNIFRLYKISIAARTIKGVGPTNETVIVRTHGEVPGASPQSLTAYNTSVSSIYAHWQEVAPDKRHGIMQGYKLAFYEWTQDGYKNLENRTYGLSVPEATFTGLKTFTKYRIKVLGFNNFGDGPFGVVDVYTDESIPSQPPSNFTAFNTSSTVLRLVWDQVPQCCRFGIILGYHVTFIDSKNASATLTTTTSFLTGHFTSLKKFHVYHLSVEAFTSKGSGPKAFASASTDQDVPEGPPQNVSGYNISQSEILISWAPVSEHKVNGIVTSYKVVYDKVTGHPHPGQKIFNGSSLQGVIDGLKPFSVYSLRVSASTIKGPGPASPALDVKTEEEAPKVTPTEFKGFNTSSTSIALSWDPIPQGQVAGVLRNFYISYRQLNTADNTTHTVAVPLSNLSFEVTNLRDFTNYSLEIKGATKFIGKPTEPIIITTDEDVPSQPPQNITVQHSSSTSLSVRWNPIPEDSIHGILLGIKLLYRSASRDNSLVFRSRARRAVDEGWSEYTNITLPPNALSHELTSLKKFTNYSIVILGFTAKGDGNVSQQFVVSTDEDVPSEPPSAFLPLSRSGDFKMDVTWGPVPDGFVHGILRGYRIYFTKTQELGRASSSQTRVITVGPNGHNTTITLLNNFAMYNLEITAFTIKGEGPRSEIKEGATCNCPREFKTTWYPLPPYMKFEDGEVGGFMLRILEHAVQSCCSDCKLPNGKSASAINFELDGKLNSAKKPGVEELISSIDSDTDFSLPVNGYQGQTHYSVYRYVKLAESPGVAFITVMDDNEKVVAIANVFIDSWPLLVLSFVMMLGAGIVMWILETRSNSAEYPRSFFQGASEGVWWAFATSTTVGYGDRCAKGVLSRLFAIAWTLCGLVVIAILTGKIATALTDFGYTGPYISLYGAKVAAISNNSDFRLGIRKNARMNTERSYKTYEEISRALADQEVKGALVDLYVLSAHKHLFEDPRFRIVRIYDYKASYGVVLAGHSMKLEDCFTEHIKEDAADVFQSIEENVKILREPEDSPGEQQSKNLFHVNSPKFITAVIVIGSLLILACALGIVYEIRRKKTATVLKHSRDVISEMRPIVDTFLANMKNKVKVMSKRHRHQRCQVMGAEKEHYQQAAIAVNQYYEVLSVRDIRQDWSTRSVTVRLKSDGNPTMWPFTNDTNNLPIKYPTSPFTSEKNLTSPFTSETSNLPIKYPTSPFTSEKNLTSPFTSETSNLPIKTRTNKKPTSPLHVKRKSGGYTSPLHIKRNQGGYKSPLHIKRKQGSYNLPTQFTLEPNVRVMDETHL